jgi:uncharacterized protein YraI
MHLEPMEIAMNFASMFRTAALLCTLTVPSFATAATAYAVGGATNMRAGPGTQFPVVGRVIGGSRVNVVGCVPSFSWCDGTVQGVRGWIAGSRLEFPYANRRVLVPEYYAYFGAPVVRFDFGSRDDRRRWRGRDGHWETGEDGNPRWRPDRDRDDSGWNPDGGREKPRPVTRCLAPYPIC